MTSRHSIRDLVEATGVPRRTIRYYVQRGLIPAPEGAGRGHFYTEEHRTLLLRARSLQAEGHSLDEITDLLRGPERDSRDSREIRESRETTVAERPAFAQRIQLAAPPDGVEAGSALDRIELVTRVHLAEGVELSFAPPARVPSPARLRAIALAVARLLEH